MLRKLILVAAVLIAVAALLPPALTADTAVDRPADPATPPIEAAADATIDPEVLAVREAAWRAWFGGDVAALAAMLPPEFISFSTRGDELGDLAATLAASRAWAASGGRLERLAFPLTRAQRYGDVVVLYSVYEATLADGAGKESVLRGRATEVFVRREGRWLHPSWHLDVAP